MTQPEIMFAQKIRLVFDKLILNKKNVKHMVQKTGNKFYEVGAKVFLSNVSDGTKDIEKLELLSNELVG